MKINLKQSKLLGFRLHNDEAIKGKKGTKNGDYYPTVVAMAGVKTGGAAGVKNGTYYPD